MLRSNVYDYSDAYIVGKGTVDLLAAAENKNIKAEKEVQFKNNALFKSSISKTSNLLLENAENLDVVMLMYNLLEQNHNCPIKPGSL